MDKFIGRVRSVRTVPFTPPGENCWRRRELPAGTISTATESIIQEFPCPYLQVLTDTLLPCLFMPSTPYSSFSYLRHHLTCCAVLKSAAVSRWNSVGCLQCFLVKLINSFITVSNYELLSQVNTDAYKLFISSVHCMDESVCTPDHHTYTVCACWASQSETMDIDMEMFSTLPLSSTLLGRLYTTFWETFVGIGADLDGRAVLRWSAGVEVECGCRGGGGGGPGLLVKTTVFLSFKL